MNVEPTGCEICDDALASGIVECHCPLNRDGTLRRHHDYQKETIGGGLKQCPARLFESNHPANGMTRPELRASLARLTDVIGSQPPNRAALIRAVDPLRDGEVG